MAEKRSYSECESRLTQDRALRTAHVNQSTRMSSSSPSSCTVTLVVLMRGQASRKRDAGVAWSARPAGVKGSVALPMAHCARVSVLEKMLQFEEDES